MALRQLPVRSPLTTGALASGLRAALGTGRAEAEGQVRRLLRERYGARRVLLTDSGTSALRLALRAAGEVRGDAVALPAFSCYDVGTAWQGAGVRPRLYDLDPATLSPDRASLVRALERGAATVVVAYLYGVPLDWDALGEAARDAGALVVEDAAQGVGCRWRGQRAGSLGDLSVLSFGRGKGWTGGGGGALMALTDAGEEALAALGAAPLRPASSSVALARAVVQWVFGRPALYGVPASLPGLRLGETVYHPPSPPGGASTASLGILLGTARLLDAEADARRENARLLLAKAEATPGARPIREPEGATPGWLRLPLLADDALADRLDTGEAEALGAMPSYPRPLYRLPPLREGLEGEEAGPLEGAERLARSLYTLPTHGLLRPGDLRAIGGLLDGGSGGVGTGPDGEADRKGGPRSGAGADASGRAGAGVPRDVLALAVLSAASLAAYLGFSTAPRAFLERASALVETILDLVG